MEKLNINWNGGNGLLGTPVRAENTPRRQNTSRPPKKNDHGAIVAIGMFIMFTLFLYCS